MAKQLVVESSLLLKQSKQAFSEHKMKCNPPERNFHHKIESPSLQLQKPELPVEVRRKEQVMCSPIRSAGLLFVT